MNATTILLPVGFAYLVVSFSLFLEKKYAMAFVFLCYALSNVGLYLVARQ